jgi:hypothetical protein
MQVYEIRILHADRSTAIVIEMMHLSDNAAVRAGKKIAEARPFEVWRDLECIYGMSLASRRSGRGIPRRSAPQP